MKTELKTKNVIIAFTIILLFLFSIEIFFNITFPFITLITSVVLFFIFIISIFLKRKDCMIIFGIIILEMIILQIGSNFFISYAKNRIVDVGLHGNMITIVNDIEKFNKEVGRYPNDFQELISKYSTNIDTEIILSRATEIEYYKDDHFNLYALRLCFESGLHTFIFNGCDINYCVWKNGESGIANDIDLGNGFLLRNSMSCM